MLRAYGTLLAQWTGFIVSAATCAIHYKVRPQPLSELLHVSELKTFFTHVNAMNPASGMPAAHKRYFSAVSITPESFVSNAIRYSNVDIAVGKRGQHHGKPDSCLRNGL